jgi:hypothetical protein
MTGNPFPIRVVELILYERILAIIAELLLFDSPIYIMLKSETK